MSKGKQRDEAEIKERIAKLVPFFKKGLTLREACIHAKIPLRTIYRYKNQIDWVGNEIEYWENYLIVKSESIIADIIEKGSNPKARLDEKLHAAKYGKWYLERRKREIYATQNISINSNNEDREESSLYDYSKLDLNEKRELVRLLNKARIENDSQM